MAPPLDAAGLGPCPADTADSTPGITVGAGHDRPQGAWTPLAPGVDALAEALRSLPSGHETWWSGHRWRDDYRKADGWRSMAAVGLDLDFHDAEGKHAPIPDDVAACVRVAAESKDLPGCLAHPTPRGARVVFALDRVVTDRDEAERVIDGAVALLCDALARLGLDEQDGRRGLRVDLSARDLARMVYAPCARVSGVQRDADVIVVRETPYSAAELVAKAPPGAQPEPSAAPAARQSVTGRVPSVGDSPYGVAALRDECACVASTPEGTRNATLNRAAFNIGQLLAGGELTDESAVVAALADAAAACKLPPGEADKTIRSGITAGRQHPRTAPPPPVKAPPADSPSPRAPATPKGVRPLHPSDTNAGWTPFPVEALPAAMRAHAEAVAAATGADVAVPALTDLIVAGACVGNRLWVSAQAGYVQPPTQWGAIVADSGGGKSPAFGLAMEPMRATERPRVASFARAWAAYDDDRKAWEREGRDKRGPRPAPPADDRILVQSATGEALVDAFARCPRGVLHANAELSEFLETINVYRKGARGPDEAWIRRAYDGEEILVQRKTPGPVGTYAPRPLLSVVGCMTPGSAASLLGGDRAETGSGSRFLLLRPPARPALLTDRGMDAGPAGDWQSLLDTVRSEPVPLDATGGPAPRIVTLDPEAREAFRSWHDERAFEAHDSNGLDAAILSKAKGRALRVAATLAAIEEAARGGRIGAVDVETMARAITLTAWAVAETRRVARQLWTERPDDAPPEDRDAEKVVAWAKKQDRGVFTLWELQKGGPFRGKGSGERAGKALDRAAEVGLVVRHTPHGAAWRVADAP